MDQSTIANVLKLLKNHTIKEVCQQTGLSKYTVSCIKNNKAYKYTYEMTRLPPGMLRKIKAVSENTNEPKSKIIKRAITRYLDTLPESTKTMPSSDLD